LRRLCDVCDCSSNENNLTAFVDCVLDSRAVADGHIFHRVDLIDARVAADIDLLSSFDVARPELLPVLIPSVIALPLM
jgi:hypothetical protein